MLRILCSTAAGVLAFGTMHEPVVATAAGDITTLMAETRGAPPTLCLLAAGAIGNGGWWGGMHAPVSPLVEGDSYSIRTGRNTPLSVGDRTLLLNSVVLPDNCTREIAVRLLGRDGSDATVAGLTQHAASRDTSLRSVAAYGLGLIERATSVPTLITLTNDAAVGARANALWALGRIGDGRALPAALRAIDDREAIVREAAATALGQLDSSAAITALIRHLRQDPAANVRRISAWALAQLEAKTADGALGEALANDKDADVREMSAWAIGNLSIRQGNAALLAAAKSDADERVRETAVWAIAERGDASAAGTVGDVLANEKNAAVRATAAWALGDLEPKTAPRGLISALTDDDERVRMTAAWALSEIGDAAALPALRTALSRPATDRTRKAQIRALLETGEDPDRLVEQLKSPDASVRAAVAQALAGKSHINPWPWPQPRPRPFP
ncbi:MAG: HEAT repeat domain-containing protein [Gemmatimonadales bacterium]|nr:HEAT repeat domain-containing protein [Gemmatimonadales bacterium]